ncbi:MAG TPA: membrane protein insertase YidC [Methylomirabilota bacterium]|jgi:YidC/Oxa1 family membrane protein insertase|nr:membrane protein insertase YidC [Methylomirabilota bacterium]
MDQKNMILAIVLSIAIILGFYYFFELPRIRAQQEALEAQRAQQAEQQRATPAPAPGAAAPAGAETQTAALATRSQALAASQRVRIDSARLTGSISLVGARIDDLVLDDYKVTTKPGSPNIELLNPVGGDEAYFAEFGWTPAVGAATPVPDRDTVWHSSGQTLTPDQPVTLSWNNGAGLRFERVIALDRDYMFTVTQRVVNEGAAPVTLFPYGRIVRVGTPHTAGFYILHEGLIGVLNGTLHEVKYKNAAAAEEHERQETTGGWLGITDKYWLVALAPDQQQTFTGLFSAKDIGGTPNYQADYRAGAVTIAPGATAENSSRLFAGAKEVKLLERYRDTLNLPLFERAVDFGYLWFLTQPIFWVLDLIYRVIGNFGVAILLLTVMVKLLFLPLANKSYRAMSQMKKLAPQMQELKEKHGEDRQKLNQEIMALYKREKVNPVSGCLPVVIQIPVFFALYKVLFVTIEMRHAPFFGWIHDLSAPDPTSLFNLFGLIPWDPPSLLAIGAWPLIMGVTMFVQQKLNPAPPDPIQAKMFMALPVVFTFMLAQFPAGLVIYWAWNNVLSIAQQRFIMWRMGVKP